MRELYFLCRRKADYEVLGWGGDFLRLIGFEVGEWLSLFPFALSLLPEFSRRKQFFLSSWEEFWSEMRKIQITKGLSDLEIIPRTFSLYLNTTKWRRNWEFFSAPSLPFWQRNSKILLLPRNLQCSAKNAKKFRVRIPFQLPKSSLSLTTYFGNPTKKYTNGS